MGAIPASDNIERGEGLLANTAPSMPAAPVGPGVFRTGSPPSRPSVHATHPVTSLYQDRQDFGYGTTATYDFVDCADLLAAERCEFPLGIAAPSEEFVNATSGLNNFTLFQVVRSGFANPTALAFANNDLGLGGDSPTYFTCLAGQTLHDNNNNNNNGDNSSSTPNSQQIMPHDSAIYRPLSTVANNRIVDESYNLSSSLTHLVFASNHQSENYKGNANLLGNQSASIPEYESCALWITNLNLFSTEEAYHQLLFAARGCGKVYACVINPPDKTKGHTTCAAKLVFWDRSGALELRRRAAAGLFIVRGYIPKVVYNRIRTASQRPGPESRVIHIDGPKCIVDKEVLLRFFASRFNFQTDEVVLLSEEPGQDGRRRLEWRFGSYRCQAASALKHIDDQRRRFPPGIGPQYDFWRQVQTYYGVDPCAPAFVPFGLQ